MQTGLHMRLYNNQINRDNLDALLKEYSRESFVAFLGAGINAAIEDVPLGGELYQDLCKKYNLTATGDKITEHSFSEVFKSCNDKANFDDYIFERVRSKHTSGLMVSIDVVCAFDRIVTTNYVEPVEDAFKRTQDIKAKLNAQNGKEFTEFRLVEAVWSVVALQRWWLKKHRT